MLSIMYKFCWCFSLEAYGENKIYHKTQLVELYKTRIYSIKNWDSHLETFSRYLKVFLDSVDYNRFN
jgi:hypothetical protein